MVENVNLTSPGNYAWTIAIPAANLTIDAKYVLRFKVPASTYDPNSAELSSPGFLVLRAAASSTSSSSTTPSSSIPESGKLEGGRRLGGAGDGDEEEDAGAGTS